MKRFRLYIMPILIAVLFLVGCPPPEEDEQDKPATPEEIRKQGEDILQSIDRLATTSPEQLQKQVGQLRTKMQTFRQAHATTETGREMIQLISSKLYNMASLLFDQEQYQLCVSACELIQVINPNHGRSQELRERAREELAKPRVVLRGFYKDEATEQLLAWVEVTYRQTGQKEARQVQVGDEFDGYRCKKIVNNAQGRPTSVVLRYVKTGKDVTLRLHP